MSARGQEVEAKFFVRDLTRIKRRLDELGARCIQERVLETNIRFDLPGAPLQAQGRVLRLRQDTRARMTYKSGSTNEQGVLSREEIEFVVEDLEKARRFLEALGYQKLFYYEKYRTTYRWQEQLIMLDELPYGDFVEIEGHTAASIQALAERLDLHMDAAIAASYHALFDRARQNLALEFDDLSFASFENVIVDESALGVHAAD